MKYIYVGLLLTVTTLCLGNNFKFKNFLPKNGLSTIKTNRVIQDSEGFIWVATDNGLNRFDGNSFRIYKHDITDSNSISGNTIMNLLIDHTNNLWISTDGGVCRYSKKLDIFYQAPDSTIAHTYCKVLTQDLDNNYWALTGSLITVFNSEWKKIQVINQDKDASDYLGNVSFFTIGVDNEGLVWLGTQEKGFFSYDLKTKTMTDYGKFMDSKEVFHVFPDNYGHIWISTHNESYLFIKSENRLVKLDSYESPLNLPKVPISYIFESAEGDIWICSWDHGVYKYNVHNDEFEFYRHLESDPCSLSKGSIEFGYQDNDGNFWFAGATSGLTVSYTSQRKIYAIKDINNSGAGIFLSPVTAITQDLKGDFWFGSDGSGLTIWNPTEQVKSIYKYNPDDSTTFGGYSALTVYSDKSGKIWSGGYNSGLNLYNSRQDNFITFLQNKPPPFTISGTDIRAITEDGEGNIWVATNGGGVNIYNPITFERKVVTVKDGLAHNYCISIQYNGNGKVLIGSYGGLSIYDIKNGTFVNYTKNEKEEGNLLSNWINEIYIDSKNRYWIGTQLGLSLFDTITKTFTNYIEKDGIINHSIMSITEDSEGNLWIGTMDGLSKFNPESKAFINFNILDGLPDNQFKMGAAYRATDNTLYFGTNKGLVFFNPKDIISNKTIPKIHFTDISINGEIILPANSDILDKHINYTKKINLKHDQNFIRIDFVGLSYYQAERNYYKYILEGVDNEWNDNKKINYASYTNIKPGRYIFKVQSFNNDGIASKIKELEIRIRPVWFKTILFRLLLIFSIAVIIYKFYKERNRRVLKDKQVLQHRIDENEKALQEKIHEIEIKEKQIEEQNKRDNELRFQHTGISKFTEFMALNRQNLNEMSYKIIAELVKYTGANAGVIYLAKETETENLKLIKTGMYCFDSDNLNNDTLLPGESYVGTCYKEKRVIQLNNLPDGYFKLSSGFGDVSLRNSLLFPIINEDICLGVIELASLSSLESYKIKFITKLSENFASIIAIDNANSKTKLILEQNKIQAEELRTQEEELRQNLEEMLATQEELRKQMEASEKANERMLFEQVLTNSLMQNSPEKIYFKDLNSQFIKVSNSMLKVFNVEKLEDIYGKSDFDFFTKEHARPAYEDEQKIIKTGKPLFDKIEKETFANGTVTYVSTSKMPLTDSKGNIIGTFGISKDITELTLMKLDLEKREEEMMAKEQILQEVQNELIEKERVNKELEKKLREK